MKQFGAQLNKKASTIRLSAAERNDLRARVVSYMEYHPLPKKASSTKATTAAPVLSEPFTEFKINYQLASGLAGFFAILTLVVVPVIAEQTVPGDVLYPVKVQFNEELRSTFSLSPYAKIEWETKRLERRLAEARLLADEGKLTEELEAEVAQAVQAHSDAAKQEIEVIRASDTDEAVIAEITLASALEVQSEVLESQEERAGETGRSVSALAGVVAEARNGIEASQELANPSYEKLLARLESETTYAQELFASVSADANEIQIADIERRFGDIQRKINAAMALHAEGTDTITIEMTEAESSVRESKQLLKTALTDTRKLITFMTDIDVRANVSIDDLLPVTLTPEEESAALQLRYETLLILAEEVEALEVAGEIEEKFTAGFNKLAAAMTVLADAVANNELAAVTTTLTEAELIAQDLRAMGQLPTATTDAESRSTSTEEIVEERASSTEGTADEGTATTTRATTSVADSGV